MSWLAAVRHCPRCGTAVQVAASAPLRCQACHLTLFANPATAVGAFVHDAQGRCLFLRRAKDPGKGLLGLPGGFVDAGEGLDEALAREVREEVGGTLASSRYLCSFPNRYQFDGITYDVCDVFFTAVLAPGALTIDPGEVAAHAWLDPHGITPADMAFPSNRKALERLLVAHR
jgi:ADP-ribose pyrophosphatase YjhB (NUDIX family)